MIEDFEVGRFDGTTLMIYGSKDFTYYHNIELLFTGVYFFSGDFSWQRNDKKPLILLEDVFEDPHTGRLKFVLETDIPLYANTQKRVVIWAREITYNMDTVLYWKKDPLEKGERIAGWLS